MPKIQIKSEKITPFGGIFPIMDEFNRVLSGIVDSTLGFRCKLFGYQYSEIIRSLMCVYFCGGTCIEDLSKHLIPCVSQHPKLRTCSSDTILRAIEELTEDNISYTSDNGKTYEFNKAEKLNTLLLEAFYNFYKYILSKLKVPDFGLKPTNRIKTFVFKFVSVAATS